MFHSLFTGNNRPSRPNRCGRLLGVLGIMALAVSVTSVRADQPNVIVILADDLGYGDLSCFGATDLASPHIDQLAKRGMRFTEFFANCPVCSPTRASLMTGRYPELVGVPGVIRTHAENSWGDLADDAVLLPQVLKQVGYHSAIIGKWHLGLKAPDRPNDRGFGHFHGYLGDMMDDYYKHRRHGINYMRLNEQEIDPEGHATDLFSQWACDYIQSRREEQAPFFLYLAYNAPHTPIQPPADWLAKVRERHPQMSMQRAKLVALIEHLDDGVGKVIDCLKQSGMEENTMVVFTSDNGGQLSVGANNGPLRDGKQSMYEGGLKVPSIVVWPGHTKAGAETDARLITMDLFPTICEVAGARCPAEVDGLSFLPTLQAPQSALGATVPDRPGKPALQRDLFFHRREGGERYGGLTIQALRRGDWKLLQNSPFQPLELYNVADDPQETRNLAAVNRAKFRDLSKALRAQIQRGGAVPWQPQTE